MQFIDVTRAMRLVIGDDTTENIPLSLTTPALYHVESSRVPELSKRIGMAIVQTKERDLAMLHAAIHSSDKKHLARRHKALMFSLKRAIEKHGWVDMPTEAKIEFDTDLIEITLIRERLYGEPVVLTADPRPGFMKKASNNNITPKDVKKALKGSGMKASIQQALGCAVCGIVTGDLKRCGRCRSAAYCSEACQRKHWPTHKTSCASPSKP